jgi:hypothetical protein
MLPVSLLNALKEYTLTQKPALPLGTTDVTAKTGLQFEVGQKVQGIVQTQLATNVFKVNVSGQLIQMELPSTVHSGDTLALQVTALQPRVTFSMASSEKPLSTPEQLSNTARVLSSLSQQTPEKAYVRATQTSPLWTEPQVPETKQLAGMLQEALSTSGLFYESHQAQWLGGDRSTAQLMQEPQNLPAEQSRAITRNSADNKPTAGNNPSGDIASENIPSGNQTMAESAAGKPPLQSNRTDLAAGVNDKAGSSIGTNPTHQAGVSSMPENKSLGIPEHLQPLVQQQLNALETNQMIWQGNIWPGQDMQWDVHEQPSQNPSVEGQRQWVTQIQLDLPNLGMVSATLRLNSAGLSLTLNADKLQTRNVLGSASTKLVSALTDAGIPVIGTQVTQSS